MFTSLYKNPFFNKDISKYCLNTTLNSIQNMIEIQKNIEKKLCCFIYDNSKDKDKFKYSNSIVLFENPKPNPINPYIILAISIPLIYFFYHSGKKYSLVHN